MKIVETTWQPDSLPDGDGRWSHYGEFLYRTKVSDVVVGLVRVYDDMEAVDGHDYAEIPKAEGKVSVRPYVRGKPRKRSFKDDRLAAFTESPANFTETENHSTLPPTEPPAQLQSKPEVVITNICYPDESCGRDESQDPRISDKRLDEPRPNPA